MPDYDFGRAYKVTSLDLSALPVANDTKMFYEAGATTTASFVKLDFLSPRHNLQVITTAANSLELSLDGTNVHAVIPADSTRLFPNLFVRAIWIKNGSGVAVADIHAWSE